MSDAVLYPSVLSGRVAAPPSKSAAHRALICAALSDESAQVAPIADSADMRATRRVLAAMGAQMTVRGEEVAFAGGGNVPDAQPVLDCGESGSTLRFLLPVAAALGLTATFTGAGRLPERPIGVLAEQLRHHGITFSGERMPFTISGGLTGGVFSLPGDISSQFVSGLLFALPLTAEGGEVRIEGTLQSAGYVDMTLAALAQAGIAVTATAHGWQVAGGQRYRGGRFAVEGDYSGAAFWLCAGAFACRAGESLTVEGLDAASPQADSTVVDILQQFGAQIRRDENVVTVLHTATLRGGRVDAAQIPDLIPVLAVVAAFAEGETEFFNAARLRIKESDRLATTVAMLRALGADACEQGDSLIVRGTGGAPLAGGVVDGVNDHRIVMAAAVAALGCTGSVRVSDAPAVDKSYPDFFVRYAALGGKGELL